MLDGVSRRDVLILPGISLVAAALHGIPVRSARADEGAKAGPGLWPEFPRQDPKLVQAIVGAAHVDEKKVRELADAHPALVNAWWDWGYGDWESPLGAASHVGRRSIAEFLIERGARMDIFAAAMLGHTDIVKSFIAARPGIQKTYGPHNIPLLAHAQAGGSEASGTLAYLEGLGDAGQLPQTVALSAQEREAFVGHYKFGPADGDRLEVTINKREQLSILRPEFSAKPLNYVGDNQFFPKGAPAVRIRFDVRDGKAVSFTVIDKDPLIEAMRVAG